jgi:hypothetical protein
VSAAFSDRIARAVSCWRVGLLLAGCLVCVSVFALREHVFLLGARSDPGPVLDSRLWYTPADALAYFDLIGPGGRSLFAVTQLTLDTVYPLLYGGVLCCLIAKLSASRPARLVVWLPVGAVATDLGENVVLVVLATTFIGEESSLAWLATGLTATKWTLIAASLLGLLVGSVWRACTKSPRFAQHSA